jgi:hypothetical protein
VEVTGVRRGDNMAQNIDFRKKDVIWTTSNYDPSNTEVINEFPYIELIEYWQEGSQIESAINNFVTRVLSEERRTAKQYTDLYSLNKTGNKYVLPFFMEENRNIENQWSEISKQSVGGAKIEAFFGVMKEGTKIAKPTAAIIQPEGYAGSSKYGYDVRFSLINTAGTLNDIAKNKRFLELITKQNLHVTHNWFNTIPPCLYSAHIPGIRWSPICTMTGLAVKNVGTMNRIHAHGFNGHIIPDAWEITLSFRELLREDYDIYKDGIESGGTSPVNVVIKDKGTEPRVNEAPGPYNDGFTFPRANPNTEPSLAEIQRNTIRTLGGG